jgi:hypothetical protein
MEVMDVAVCVLASQQRNLCLLLLCLPARAMVMTRLRSKETMEEGGDECRC